MSDLKQDAIESLSLTVREQYLEIERLTAEVERQKSTIESFQIQALAENNTCLEQAYKIDRLTAEIRQYRKSKENQND
jgi:uncharacterized coiled-coil protein SlyX